MSDLKLGTRTVGAAHPTFIIAEIGINHQGDVEIAKELITKAKECGADAVKFQKRTISRILSNILRAAHPYIRATKYQSLPWGTPIKY